MTNNQEKLQNSAAAALVSIGKQIEAARKKKFLSTREVSKITEISETTISNLEKGKLKNITFNNLVSICNVVNINLINF